MTSAARAFLLLAALASLACGPALNPGVGDACSLADENDACPECADGEVTCTYGDHSVTAVSCGGCQARSDLYRELCDDGVAGTAQDIEDGTTCTEQPLQ